MLRRMSLKVSAELYDFIREEASREGLSMNAIIVFALNNYKDQKTVAPDVGAMQELLELVRNEEKAKRSGLSD